MRPNYATDDRVARVKDGADQCSRVCSVICPRNRNQVDVALLRTMDRKRVAVATRYLAQRRDQNGAVILRNSGVLFTWPRINVQHFGSPFRPSKSHQHVFPMFRLQFEESKPTDRIQSLRGT